MATSKFAIRLSYLLKLIYTWSYAWIFDIDIGKHTVISPGAKIRSIGGGRVTLGNYTEISDGAMLLTYGGDIKIGDNCTIQPFSIVYGHGGVKIGSGVRIAAHCVVIPANHKFDDVSVPIYQQGLSSIGIEIKDNVWIASGSKILDGVTVGSGAVIAAGSVVNRSVEPCTIVGGVPAKEIRKRK